MGHEPVEDKIPIEFGDFPPDVQEILEIYSFLPNKWEGMSGSYIGKDFGLLPELFNIYETVNKKFTLTLLVYIDRINIDLINEEQTRKIKKGKK